MTAKQQNEGAATAPAPARPIWVTPERVELEIWADTLGSNVPLLGDQVFTRITSATPS
jgi:hypothetical protein